MAAITGPSVRHASPRRTSDPFLPLVVVTALVAAVAPAAPGGPGPLSVGLALVAVALLGIPHGAVDHLVAQHVAPGVDGRPDLRFQRRFHLWYLAVMAATALLWLVAPAASLAVFLVASAHHFGQSDLAHLGLPRARQRVLQASRGVMLVGLPLVAHLGAVSPVVGSLGGGDPSRWPWLADRWQLWCGLVVAQHVAVGIVVARRALDRATVAREAVAIAVLAALLVRVDPLLGFAVYFGLWHSLAHLRVLSRLLGSTSSGGAPLPMPDLLRLAAPRSLAALVGLGALVATASTLGRPDLVIPAGVVAVSILTLPHLVVVEHLWRAATWDERPR